MVVVVVCDCCLGRSGFASWRGGMPSSVRGFVGEVANRAGKREAGARGLGGSVSELRGVV